INIQCREGEYFATASGEITDNHLAAYRVDRDDVQRIFQNITRNSVYALDEELRNGYITIPGGHRVGFTGEAVLAKGRLQSLKNISFINIRVSREVRGCADTVMPFLIDPSLNNPYHTLIISPPKCGKTTLLRDIIRQLSNGIHSLGFSGINVGLVDERSEIAACHHGLPQNDVGVRTDVLDKCPKAEGMYMLVRSMAPQVIATDELGKSEDIPAVEEAINAGIKLITTVHGTDVEDIMKRPVLKKLLQEKLFERILILSRRRGAGTIEAVVDGRSGTKVKGITQRRGDQK
ncbi:MAG: stage III sporulation protein AA, partial [Clostridia bacterium]|nr:stage III sporulation protein AA [Clostridia bacterium]